LTITISTPRPGKRYTANAVPNGAPIAKAQALAVRLTANDNKTMPRNSASKLPINVKAVWNAAAKSLMPGVY
jgi:hypothetical protein